MRNYKVRSGNRALNCINTIKERASINWESLARDSRFYRKFYVSPWSNLVVQTTSPKPLYGRIHKAIPEMLKTVSSRWKSELESRGVSGTLYIWYYPEEPAMSQIIVDVNGFYQNSFEIVDEQNPWLAFSGNIYKQMAQMGNWSIRTEPQLHEYDEINQWAADDENTFDSKSYAQSLLDRVEKGTAAVETYSGTSYIVLRDTKVWVCELTF